MQKANVYSERLGAISDEQFHAVAQRLQIGRFLKAAPTTSGLFGQNVFVTTTEGEFVLRGAPHWVKELHEEEYHPEDRWQFTKEKYFAEQLHTHTDAPVPWPMLHDQTNDILGWPYLRNAADAGHVLRRPQHPQSTGAGRSAQRSDRAGRDARRRAAAHLAVRGRLRDYVHHAGALCGRRPSSTPSTKRARMQIWLRETAT